MLSAGWLVYALVTGALVTVAAFAAEALCRQHGKPVRWVWAVALLAVATLTTRAITARPEPEPQRVSVALMPASSVAPSVDAAPDLVRSLMSAATTARAVLSRLLENATRQVPAAVAAGAVIAWLVASLLALFVIAGVHLRIARVGRRWPAAELHGLEVRIAPSVGPAVLGVLRPFIVVPRWLLARSADEQRLVLTHESEHVRARDHLLLTAACVVAALVPWHPATWIMLARLRLAIELDCDARVLRRGVAPRAYGTMLIELAGQCSGFTVGATALADEASHLQRRLLAMKPTAFHHARLRIGVLAAAGMLAVLVACEAKLPTSADVQNMDVASAERAATSAKLATKNSMEGAEFLVDGRAVSAEVAHAIPASRIASVNIERLDAQRSRISIVTGDNPSGVIHGTGTIMPQARAADSTKMVAMHMKHAGTAADSAQMATMHVQHSKEMAKVFAGVLLVDGVKVSTSDMAQMNPNDIASVEVIKGASALALSSDPAAINGVIRVTTKAGGTMKARSSTP